MSGRWDDKPTDGMILVKKSTLRIVLVMGMFMGFGIGMLLNYSLGW